jgi:hypothetical protein
MCGHQSVFDYSQDQFRQGVTHIVWTGNSFNGLFDDTYNEGAWYRLTPTTIRAKPDASTSAFRDHDAVDWVHRNGNNDVSGWVPIHSFGMTTVTLISRSDVPLLLNTPYDNSPLGCVQLPVLQNSVILWMMEFMRLPAFCIPWVRRACVREWFDARVINYLSAYTLQRKSSVWTRSGLLKHATQYFEEKFPRLRELFPEVWTRELVRHVNVVFIECGLTEAAALHEIAPQLETSLNRTHTHMKTLDSPQTSSRAWFWMVTAAAGVVAWVFRARISALSARAAASVVAKFWSYWTVPTVHGINPQLLQALANPERTVETYLTLFGPNEARLWPANGTAKLIMKGVERICGRLPSVVRAYFPIAGVIVEETLNAHVVGQVVNTVADVTVQSYVGAIWHAVAPLFVPWYVRVPVHLLYNACCDSLTSTTDDWLRFKETFYDGGKPLTIAVPGRAHHSVFAPYQSFVPRQRLPCILQLKPKCPDLKWEIDRHMRSDG